MAIKPPRGSLRPRRGQPCARLTLPRVCRPPDPAARVPQPVVLDSRLSIAASLDIKLLSSDSCERPWIMCLPMAHRNTTAVRGLEDAGATVVTCSAGWTPP